MLSDLKYEGGAKLAADFFHEIEVTLDTVRERPLSFAPYNDVLRRTSVNRYPFHILFSIEPEHALVLVVRHHRRHPDFGLDR